MSEKKMQRVISYYFPDNRDSASHAIGGLDYTLDEAAGDSFTEGQGEGDDVLVQRGVTITVRRGWFFRTDVTREKKSIQELMIEKAEQG